MRFLPNIPNRQILGYSQWQDALGQEVFRNIIPGAALKTEPLYVAFIMRVIHDCMGGLEIDENSAVQTAVADGVFSAGS